jgi:RimJ/RimL family protein N-acetyltransferase/acyl carrier protein
MFRNQLIKTLNLETPIDIDKEIFFINLNKSKKYFLEWFEYSKNDKFFEFLEYSSVKKKNEFNLFVKELIKTESNYKNFNYQKFWLIINEKNELVGTAKLTNIHPVRKSVEWGFGINPKLWGTNYVSRIQLSLLNYVFNKLNFHRLYGTTQVNNFKVIKSVQLFGFKKEGIKRDYYFNTKNHTYYDAYSYALLKNDFKKNNSVKNIFFKKENRIKNFKATYENINNTIAKVLKKKILLKKNIKMNNINEWNSLSHFDIICSLEKKFKKKFTNKEIVNSSSTENILKILKQ